MRYEWDNHKEWVNRLKHAGLSFERALLVFDDPRCLFELDRLDETGEQRWQAIGTVPFGRGIVIVLFVVHVYREDRYGEEIVRLISARRADKGELGRYQKQAVD